MIRPRMKKKIAFEIWALPDSDNTQKRNSNRANQTISTSGKNPGFKFSSFGFGKTIQVLKIQSLWTVTWITSSQVSLHSLKKSSLFIAISKQAWTKLNFLKII